MQIARVVGTVVSTQKHRKFEGAKLLLVQPLNLDDTPRGSTFLAVDGVGAGVDEKVLIVLEGRAAGEALGKKGAPVDAAIVGIIDQVRCRWRSLIRNCARWCERRSHVRGIIRSLNRQARVPFARTASHGLLTLVTGGDPDGHCLIEPAVRCNHCGYCQSMGH